MIRFVMRCLLIATCLIACTTSHADDWPGFRGIDRQDISKETGLLKSWPEGGPQRVWMFEKAGLGYSGPAIVDGKMFIMGTRDERVVLFALNAATGEELWHVTLVDEVFENNWGDGPRSTPAVSGGMVYAMTSAGDLVCVKIEDGKAVWRRNMTEFGGSVPKWGYSESPLVDGDRVICTPGGNDGAVIALNAKTGDLIWQSEEVAEDAHYSSVIKAKHNGVEQYIQLTPKLFFGLAADTGKLIWQSDWNGQVAVIPTPIYRDGKVYVTSGYGVGCKLVSIDQKNNVSDDYRNKVMKNHHGGVILIGDHLYGHSDKTGWVCQNFLSGEQVWREKNKLGKGAIASADGMLYCLDERSGDVALVEATAEGWNERGRFTLAPQTKLRKRSGRIWTHPVIANGKMYLRDQDLIYCYDVSGK